MDEENQIHEVEVSRNGTTYKATYFVENAMIHANINGKMVSKTITTIPPRQAAVWLLEAEIDGLPLADDKH
ncbi:hypothetical protein [Devosia sp. MC521]|uniref:hypothetical protein n=1 Tax=Devosia sp. MC521 TaxID=2759954 RepID=UPI0015F7ABC3|nr:hypothetical protein [Devosia sp. MC521]MBJ6986908.1 hypothetical protein [Devosia sp. MC521]QMW63934.1 hypothetical protein H4N61_06350 [Devosia sp. MC521]